jgi:phosphatidylinositol-3-phosphatase
MKQANFFVSLGTFALSSRVSDPLGKEYGMKMNLTLKSVAACLLAVSIVSPGFANEGNVPKGVPRLDHVFVIMMENHGFNQIVGNPNAPFVNHYMKSVNVGTNYFAVAHPSLTNYLEVVGGSNFGVLNDNSPDWGNGSCTTNLTLGTPSLDNGKFGPICPIYGSGTDSATPLIDYSNETSPPAITAVTEIDGVHSYAAASNTLGKTIADQLVAAGLSWKSYQESLPPGGANKVNYSDGFYSNITSASDLTAIGATQAEIVNLYAVKHNPFVYFQNVQNGHHRDLSLERVVGFEGDDGLFEDLALGHVPNYSFIAPNQCNDQHGKGNASPACFGDPNDQGTLVGLNPGLISQGDLALRNLIKAIHASPAWHDGRNAIVVLWDENDYSAAPYPNRVLLTVDTNYGTHGKSSSNYYTHFSLLRSIEAGFRLPCLNHACDASTAVMSDLFASDRDDD